MSRNFLDTINRGISFVIILFMVAACGKDTSNPELPLEIPTGVTATLNGDNVTITWNRVKGAQSYDIFLISTYFSGSKTTVALNETNNFHITKYVYEGDNYYFVSAVNQSGATELSDPAYIKYTPNGGNTGGNTGGGGGTLSAPTWVTASKTNSSGPFNISWSAVSGATSYKVYRSSNEEDSNNCENKTYYQIGSSSSTNYTDNNLPNGYNYNFYKIKAVNNAGESNYSPCSNLIVSNVQGGGGGGTTNPCKPSVSGSITFTTLYANFYFSCTVSNVVVDVWNPMTSSWKTLSTLSGSATSYSISPYRDYMNTTNVNDPYYYFVKVRITGKNSNGTGDPSYIYYDILTGGIDYD